MARTPYSVFIEKRMRTAGFSSKLIRPVKYIPRIGRERGVLDRKSKGQRNEEGAQNHERHRGGDQAETAQSDGAAILAG